MRQIGSDIKRRREELGWSQIKLGALAGVTHATVSRIESGRMIGSWETLTKLAGALGVSLESLLVTKGNVVLAPSDWRTVPILNYREAADWTAESVASDPRETIMTDLERPPSTFALRIIGPTMDPRFKDGDIVVIDPTLIPDPGDFVVANDGDGDALFRQYREVGRDARGTMIFELLPLNTLYPRLRSDRQQLAIVGVMVEHRTYRSNASGARRQG